MKYCEGRLVLMPLRASCSFQPISCTPLSHRTKYLVLMPLRASCSFQQTNGTPYTPNGIGRFVLMPLRASCSFQLTSQYPFVLLYLCLNAPQGFMLIPTLDHERIRGRHSIRLNAPQGFMLIPTNTNHTGLIARHISLNAPQGFMLIPTQQKIISSRLLSLLS